MALLGVAAFLLGLIVAVEAPPAPTPAISLVPPDGELAGRVTELESRLADRGAQLAALRDELAGQQSRSDALAEQLAALRSELAAQRTESDTLAGQLAAQRSESDALAAQLSAQRSESEALEKQLAALRSELAAQQSESNALAGKLAEALQTRDELRAQLAELQRDSEVERQRFEQATARLRQQLEAANRASARLRADYESQVADLRAQVDVLEEAAIAAEAARVPAAPVPPGDAAAEASQPPIAADEGAGQPRAPTPPAEEKALLEPDTIVSARKNGRAPEAGREDKADVAAEATPAAPAPPAEAEPETKQTATGGPITRGIEAYRAGNYREAYETWLPLAQAGSRRAQFFVGALYLEGRGVPTNLVKSFLWLRSATAKSDPGALKLLDRVRARMSEAEILEVERRINRGDAIPDD